MAYIFPLSKCWESRDSYTRYRLSLFQNRACSSAPLGESPHRRWMHCSSVPVRTGRRADKVRRPHRRVVTLLRDLVVTASLTPALLPELTRTLEPSVYSSETLPPRKPTFVALRPLGQERGPPVVDARSWRQ